MTLGVSFHEAAQREFDEATDIVLRGRVRKMRVARFPYAVLYSIVSDQIRVIAVAHDRRRPFYWSGRR